MTRDELYTAVDTLRDLLNGSSDGYAKLVEIAEANNYTLAYFDRLVNIIEQAADSMP